MKYITTLASGTFSVRIKINKKVRALMQLEEYVSSKAIIMTDCSTDPNSSVKKVTWEEEDPNKWLGTVPSIEVIYDCLYHFVYTVSFQVDVKRSSATQEDLLNILLLDLVDCGAIDKEVAFGDKADNIELQQQQMRARYEATKKSAFRGNTMKKKKPPLPGGGVRQKPAARPSRA